MKILLIDDELEWIQSVSRTLQKYGIVARDDIHSAQNSTEAYLILDRIDIDLVLLDLYLGAESGEDLLARILAKKPKQHVVIVSGLGSIENAVNCMKKGAMDYFVKSASVSEFIGNLKRIIKIIRLENENIAIKGQLSAKYSEFSSYITCSSQMYSAFDYLYNVSKSSQHILITGESGVGKGVLAEIVAKIARPGKPFISSNLAGHDDQVFADTIFGHVKGAFTGADNHRQGLIQQGGDGVIFMDEIGDLSLQSQVKLLYLLQDGTYQQLGNDKTHHTCAKFIFATNQDLAEKLKNKSLRADLFYRLNTHRLHIPPLRQRQEDIPLLIKHFAKEAALDFSKPEPVFTDAFMEAIKKHPLPGNIRQLKSIVYDLTARWGQIIDVEQLYTITRHEPVRNDFEFDLSSDELPTIEVMTNILIKKAMEKAQGNQVRAAKMLGISQPTLSRKLRELN